LKEGGVSEPFMGNDSLACWWSATLCGWFIPAGDCRLGMSKKEVSGAVLSCDRDPSLLGLLLSSMGRLLNGDMGELMFELVDVVLD